MNLRVTTLLLAGIGFLLTTGCASKVTRMNYDTIKVGASTKLEVENTLGKTYTARGDNEWQYEEEDRHLDVVIHFDEAGKVCKKEWIDARTGEWSTDPEEPSEGRKVLDKTSNTTIKKN